MVIPVGGDGWLQRLIRATRVSAEDFDEQDLGPVIFVPVIGAQGWPEEDAAAGEHRPGRAPPAPMAASPILGSPVVAPSPAEPAQTLAERVARAAEPFADVDDADLDRLLGRIGDRRLVLLGEASHGTSEFYRLRARITRELVERARFTIVAVEADWPDAAWVDRWVRGAEHDPHPEEAFSRFPVWMWRNAEVLEFLEWLRRHNAALTGAPRAGFYGLDLYSMYSSIDAVVRYLDRVDPETARLARHRYACLTPFQSDPQTYGLAAITERYRNCEADVLAMLEDLRGRRGQALLHDGRGLLDAEQNARVAANAEAYYRAMYVGGAESWNLRDSHMFETLETLLAFHGPSSRAVVWAHNSHLGDASATAMARRGELNLGQLVRQSFGGQAYLVGFGTDHGTVATADDWDGPMKVKRVRPSHADSYERLCHESAVPAFMLPVGTADWLPSSAVT